MITTLSFLFIVLVVPSYEQDKKIDMPRSPCPNVFMYEPPGSEPGRWYGVVNLSTDNTLHSLWLNILLDSKADILGNWVGYVSTTDNMNFKIENTKIKIQPGPDSAVRFFVKYNTLNPAPRLKLILLNGIEICNDNIPLPAEFRPVIEEFETASPQPTRPIERPIERPVERPVIPVEDIARPVDTKPWQQDENQMSKRPNQDGPVYFPPVSQALPLPSKIDVGPNRNDNQPSPEFNLTPSPPFRATSPPRNDPEDFDENSRIDPSEYFQGGPTIRIPDNKRNGQNNEQNRVQCGTVVQKPSPLILNGRATREGEWPWQIALYRSQIIDNAYICGGSLVSHKHVITAAHCISLKSGNRVVNKDTLTVYLGKYNLRISTRGVQIRFVEEIIKHPLYNATTFTQDLAILVLQERVVYTDWVRPVCLWPENLVDLNNVIDRKGSVVGWGSDERGLAIELTLVEMPIVSELTCLKSHSQFFHQYINGYTYCAGYRNGSSVCNGDSGGGMVFNINNVWYLRGLVSLSVARHNESRCDPNHFIVFTDLAKFLSWLKQYINDY